MKQQAQLVLFGAATMIASKREGRVIYGFVTRVLVFSIAAEKRIGSNTLAFGNERSQSMINRQFGGLPFARLGRFEKLSDAAVRFGVRLDRDAL